MIRQKLKQQCCDFIPDVVDIKHEKLHHSACCITHGARLLLNCDCSQLGFACTWHLAVGVLLGTINRCYICVLFKQNQTSFVATFFDIMTPSTMTIPAREKVFLLFFCCNVTNILHLILAVYTDALRPSL